MYSTRVNDTVITACAHMRYMHPPTHTHTHIHTLTLHPLLCDNSCRGVKNTSHTPDVIAFTASLRRLVANGGKVVITQFYQMAPLNYTHAHTHTHT